LISLVTSSYQPENAQTLSASVQQTIDVPYELITIDNPGTMGICAAYNKGAAKARYDILCFVHDDIQFVTQDWGSKLMAHFEADANAGVIGVAGSVCKCKMPSSWWQPVVNDIEPKRMNIIQHFKHSNNTQTGDSINPRNEERSVVATLDGVFLAVKKDVWKKYPFDEKLLKGFHGYDTDLTLNIGRTHNNYVVYDILLEHFSEGITGMDWLKAVIAVHKKWNGILPVVKDNGVNDATLKNMDRYWFDYLLSVQATPKDKWEKFFLCLRLLPYMGMRNLTMTDLKRFKILLQQ
jgi:glycosyltransferase involved in cell wall biosynthesis